ESPTKASRPVMLARWWVRFAGTNHEPPDAKCAVRCLEANPARRGGGWLASADHPPPLRAGFAKGMHRIQSLLRFFSLFGLLGLLRFVGFRQRYLRVGENLVERLLRRIGSHQHSRFVGPVGEDVHPRALEADQEIVSFPVVRHADAVSRDEAARAVGP